MSLLPRHRTPMLMESVVSTAPATVPPAHAAAPAAQVEERLDLHFERVLRRRVGASPSDVDTMALVGIAEVSVNVAWLHPLQLRSRSGVRHSGGLRAYG